jgi:signal recognition particle subunit SRP68
MQASAGNAEDIRDDLNGLDKAVSAVLGLRTIERNQLLVTVAKSKFAKHRDEKNEKITKPEELVRLYDLLIQVSSFKSWGFLFSCPRVLSCTQFSPAP